MAGNVNQGISVLAMAKANLKCMIYNLRHVTCCSWPIVWGDITLVRVQRLLAKAEMEASHKDPSTLPTIEAKNWPKTFKAINEYLQGLRGCKGHPLSYVFCVNLITTAHAMDPATHFWLEGQYQIYY